MKKNTILTVLIFASSWLYAQTNSAVINTEELHRIESRLASDEMLGRNTGSPEIGMAADFIAAEFAKTGLLPLEGAKDYKQQFTLVQPRQTSLTALVDGKKMEEKNILIITDKEKLTLTENNQFEKIEIAADKVFFQEVEKNLALKKDLIILTNTRHSKSFKALNWLKKNIFKSNCSYVFILADEIPVQYSIEVTHEIKEQPLQNVAGMLPGKSLPNEYVIFSAHYDHIGIGKPVDGDSIYNGANDDASGTTAMLLLADYFKKQNNNERSLIFVAFTAEEIGGFGSQYFSKQLNPGQIAAMCNIEMIGTESKWGKNSGYITGYEKTDMGDILQKNLEGTGFMFYPDPYKEQQLFYRSDNATLARLGVPAHTISTSKMDVEPHYHQPSDEIETLDLHNMAKITESIALSMRTIISGKDTPSRVKVSELQ